MEKTNFLEIFFQHLGITFFRTRIKRKAYFLYIIVKLLQSILEFLSLGLLRITWSENMLRWVLSISK